MPTTLEQPAPTFQDVWRMFQGRGSKSGDTFLRTMRKKAFLYEIPNKGISHFFACDPD